MFRRVFPLGSLRHSVASNTVSQMIGRLVSTVMMTGVSLLIAQRFGPRGYGDFVKITTFVGFFYLFADFGLNAVYIQDVVHTVRAFGDIKAWRRLLGLRIVVSFFLVCTAFIILLFLPHGKEQGYTPIVRFGILLLIPAIIAQAITTTTNALFQQKLRYDLSMIAQNAGSVSMMVLAAVLVWLTRINGAYLGVLSIGLGSFVTAVIALRLVRQQHVGISPVFQVRSMIHDIMSAFPLGMTLILNLVYFHSDSVVLTLTRSTGEVGIYGLAYKVFELPLVFPLFFMNAVYPLLLQAGHKRKNSNMMFWRSFIILLVSSVVTTVGLWISAPLLTFVRPDFAESIAPLRVLILGLPVFFVSSLFMWVLIAQRKQWRLLAIHGVAMAVNMTLNIMYIPKYGYMAAAWITTFSELCVLLATGYFVFLELSVLPGNKNSRT